ncbi:hypothetical protein MTR_3g052200 [Medicago truncatula]|uniref:Uncharacterized protein n=1 Tax=Medicago truncatula TaxID=3880 RepID=G7IY19_MEDTR|nr:hypothetical protein MTR_3g052200 [Medicago truncatula]
MAVESLNEYFSFLSDTEEIKEEPGQALIGLSLAYENFCRSEPGLWPFIGLFFWPGLTYLKVWPGQARPDLNRPGHRPAWPIPNPTREEI